MAEGVALVVAVGAVVAVAEGGTGGGVAVKVAGCVGVAVEDVVGVAVGSAEAVGVAVGSMVADALGVGDVVAVDVDSVVGEEVGVAVGSAVCDAVGLRLGFAAGVAWSGTGVAAASRPSVGVAGCRAALELVGVATTVVSGEGGASEGPGVASRGVGDMTGVAGGGLDGVAYVEIGLRRGVDAAGVDDAGRAGSGEDEAGDVAGVAAEGEAAGADVAADDEGDASFPVGVVVGAPEDSAVPTRSAASVVGSLSGALGESSSVRLETAAPPSRSTANTADISANSLRRGVRISCNADYSFNPHSQTYTILLNPAYRPTHHLEQGEGRRQWPRPSPRASPHGWEGPDWSTGPG